MSALGDRRFRRLLAGKAISTFGDSALYLSMGIWAKDLTGSNAAAGLVFLAMGVPCLAAPLAGHLTDRVRRKPLLVATNAFSAMAVLGLLAVHSVAQLWLIYLVAFFYGAAFTIIRPAQAGLLKDALPDADLAGANAANTTVGQGLRIISPLAGAAIYSQLGGGTLAVIDAITFVAAIAALLSIHVEETDQPTPGVPFHTEILAGIAHLRHTPLLAQITRSAATVMLVLGFYESLTFAVIAALGQRPSFFGVLMSIQAAGSIIGGLCVSRLIHRVGEARTLGISLAVWAIASLAYAIPSLPVDCAAIGLFGIAVPLCAVAVVTATQRHTPPRLQGRANAASDMATNVAQTISIAAGAALVDTIGYQPLLLIIVVVVGGTALPLLARPARAPMHPVVRTD